MTSWFLCCMKIHKDNKPILGKTAEFDTSEEGKLVQVLSIQALPILFSQPELLWLRGKEKKMKHKMARIEFSHPLLIKWLTNNQIFH